MDNLPSIIILPGWRVSSDRYDSLKRYFSKSGFNTYIFGFAGFEENKPLLRYMTLTDYAKAVLDFISEKKMQKVVLIGHSFGGRVALLIASKNPIWLEKLILTGTPGFVPVNSLKRNLFLIFSKIGKIIFYLPILSRLETVSRKILYRLSGSVDYLHVNGYLKETFQSVIKEDLVPFMKTTNIPTLLIWGENDTIVPFSVAERMEETIKNCTLRIIPHGTHGVPYMNDKEFYSITGEFITKSNL